MTVSDLLAYFDGIPNTAEKLGVTYQAVQQWDEKGEVPEGRQWKAQALSGGALKVDEKYLPAA